jgi:hypothetical protein
VEKHLGSCDATCLAVAVNKLEAVTKEAKVTVQIPINANDTDNDETDKVEDQDLLKRLLEKKESDGSIDLGGDQKGPRRKWWERLMEIMDKQFAKSKSKIPHIIDKLMHGFHDILKKRGFDKKLDPLKWDKAALSLMREIQEKFILQGDLPIESFADLFERLIEIDGHQVTVEAVIYNGLPKIGTAYIKAFKALYT